MCIRSVNRRFLRALITSGALTLVSGGASWSQGYPSRYDFGAPATAEDISAVAIAIPADGTDLPPGKGDALSGKRVYETACAACHGGKMEGVAGLPDVPSGPALRLIGVHSPRLSDERAGVRGHSLHSGGGKDHRRIYGPQCADASKNSDAQS